MFEFFNEKDLNKIKAIINQSLIIIREYDWLINSYVLDFYVENHWNKLPSSWRDAFDSLDPEQVSDLLLENNTKFPKVWPLSILTLRAILKTLCIPRFQENNNESNCSSNSLEPNELMKHPKLRNIFMKCIKSKKRHEIINMAKICYQSAQISGAKYVIDFGAGLGHLARVISYGYGLNVCCLEMQPALNEQAKIIDQKLEITAKKHLAQSEIEKYKQPIHITLQLTKDVTADEIIHKVKCAFNMQDESNGNFSFGIIGLHPCGDLGSILSRLFLNCPEAKFLHLVGCCYMKLTTDTNLEMDGYPLSNYIINLHKDFYHLSHEAREIACHAIEMYTERLQEGTYEDLKVHSYRAALEKIIVKYWPDMKHVGLKSVKHASDLSFSEYCEKAMLNFKREVPYEDIESPQIEKDLKDWKRVVIFYSLRLMFAPLIESILLYDRILFFMENDCHVNINAIFDPKISPRNHITTAIKNDKKNATQ